MSVIDLFNLAPNLVWYWAIPLIAIPAILGITLHEVAHGWVAKQFGDETASRLGRITVNPIKHVDPIGTLFVPTVLVLTTGYAFGWAKPVPVNAERLRNPKRDMAFVAVAGPAANLLMALGWAFVFKIAIVLTATETGEVLGQILATLAAVGIVVNTILMVLNLIPLPPLDGGRILKSVLPNRVGYFLDRIELFGLVIIVLLIVSGILGRVIWPAITSVVLALEKLIGIN